MRLSALSKNHFQRLCLGALLYLFCAYPLANPVIVRDINPGPADTQAGSFYLSGGLLFFSAFLSPFGFEVWRTDGTTAGTFMVQDLRSGFNDGSNPGGFSRLDNAIVFSAIDDDTTGLFVTRGAADDILRIKEGFAAWQTFSAELGNELLLGGSEIGSLGGDKELWKIRKESDVLFTTVRVKDINPGPLASFPEELLTVEDRVYFRANDGAGDALWQSDGTDAGTTIVLASPGNLRLQFPEGLANVSGRLFTAALSNDHGNELWVVESGNARVIDICPGTCGAGAAAITAVGSLAYFRSLGDSSSGAATGAELWRSDGTLAGTWQVREIGPGARGGMISNITDFDGTVFYFTADDETHGMELWRSDGTEAGTQMVKDINPGPADGLSSGPGRIAVARNRVYFAADDGTNGVELWQSDGTEAGTRMIADLNTAGDGRPANFSLIGDRLIFTATDVASGAEIWALELPLFADGFEGMSSGPIR